MGSPNNVKGTARMVVCAYVEMEGETYANN